MRHPFSDEVLYFAIPDRFDDGNPSNNCGAYDGPCVAGDTQENVLTHGYLPSDKGYYHGGDIAGLRERLPYLEGLGVSAIWVGPIFRNKPVQSDTTNLYGHSSGYHGYWILDYLHVDPHLGTNAEFAALVDDAHARGMKVFMDIVTNHTADVIQLEGHAGYRNKRDFPYRDVNGVAFDDSDYAYAGQADYTFPEVDESSFPYVPTVPAGEDGREEPRVAERSAAVSQPREHQLQRRELPVRRLLRPRRPLDRAARGGRGDGRHLLLLDRGVRRRRIPDRHDEAREPRVLAGLRAGDPRRRAWCRHRGLLRVRRGLRPAVRLAVHEPLLDTRGELQSTIDFGFQLAARTSRPRAGRPTACERSSRPTTGTRTPDSNAYAQPTFLGNHDMGRIGYFLQRVDQLGASDAELLARSRLAHALMFFARGQPVVYYGDEQGFTGDGGDKDAREDMFANAVPCTRTTT